MSRANKIEAIMQHLVDVHDYTRMQTLVEVHEVQTYTTFLEWNAQCLNEQTDAQLDWITELCRQIQGDICLMDLESCSVFTAFAIYYTKKKKLCIVNPR